MDRFAFLKATARDRLDLQHFLFRLQLLSLFRTSELSVDQALVARSRLIAMARITLLLCNMTGNNLFREALFVITVTEPSSEKFRTRSPIKSVRVIHQSP